MTEEEQRKNLRERFNKYPARCCNNSYYARLGSDECCSKEGRFDFNTPPKRSLWQRIKDWFSCSVIKRPITSTPDRDKLIDEGGGHRFRRHKEPLYYHDRESLRCKNSKIRKTPEVGCNHEWVPDSIEKAPGITIYYVRCKKCNTIPK